MNTFKPFIHLIPKSKHSSLLKVRDQKKLISNGQWNRPIPGLTGIPNKLIASGLIKRLALLSLVAILSGASNGAETNRNPNADQPHPSSQRLAQKAIPDQRKLPLSPQDISKLGRAVLDRKIPRQAFETASMHYVIQLVLEDADLGEFDQFIKFLRPYGRISPLVLSVWHMASFYREWFSRRLLQAWGHGTSLLESPLLPLLSPPDMELFLHTLNSLAEKNGLSLPHDFVLPVDVWPLPSKKTLLLASRCFYLLRRGDKNLASAWNLDLSKPENEIFAPSVDIWAFLSENRSTSPKPGIKALKRQVEPEMPLSLPPEDTFYRSLVGSFLFLSSTPPELAQTSSRVKVKSRSRKARVRRKRWNDQDISAETLDEASIHHAKRSFEVALSDFHRYIASLQLAYLYKKKNLPLKEAQFVLKSLEYHPTVGAHLRLAEHFRDQGDWKKMHFHNSKAQKIDPNISIIAGPMPSVSREPVLRRKPENPETTP
jgi:hypothetical protein